ncbi:TWiK family of potassium channels protein 9-like [Daphnia pulicaria]|uniref:TWiK family of potassium channels protein 9-like n=1 Tax=Daphnia pulicaria TaxID=35523 RepID=UPI001EEA6D89|nr:TWiK family of potassium channels protein 9-like [Daphnia pulicaria]
MPSSSGGGEGGGEKPKGKCLFYLRNIATFLVSHIGLVSLVVGYCIMGAFTFEALEAKHELQVKREMIKVREGVTDDLWRFTYKMDVLVQDDWTVNVTDRLKKFEMHLIESMKKKGWDGSEETDKVQWTLAGALFYSIILITTIGYGHIAPKTPWGKMVTIFYAILGIPLMLLCLANIGDAMAHSFRFLYWKVCCYVCTKKPKKSRLRRQRTRRSNSGRQSARYQSSAAGPAGSKVNSLRRSQRYSQRSADSAMSDSAVSRSSYSETDQESKFYDDAEREFDMMQQMNGPQRGRRSQHHGRNNRPITTAPGSTRPGRGNNAETEMGPGGGAIDYPPSTPTSPSTPKTNDPNAMESGFFNNKYADDQADNNGRNKTDHPTDAVNKSGVDRNRGGSDKRHDRLELESDLDGVEGKEIMRPMAHRYSNRSPGTSGAGSGSGGSNRLSRLTEQEEVDYDDDYVYEDDYIDSEEEEDVHHNKPVPIWLSILLVVGYIFGGAFLFSGWEQWSFLDSAYFCFITLTTIGFGDFVPAQNVKENVEISIALCSLYLLFGIALLAMSFNLVQEEVINSVKSVAKRLGIIKDDDDEDDR